MINCSSEPILTVIERNLFLNFKSNSKSIRKKNRKHVMGCRTDGMIQTAEGIPGSCVIQAGTGQTAANPTHRERL